MNETELNELRDYLKGLTPEQLGMTVPASQNPLSGLYVRPPAEMPEPPACLDGYVIRLRTGNQATKERAVADLGALFCSLWWTGPLLPGATVESDVPTDYKSKDAKKKWDRLMTPRYHVDVIELDAKRLAVLLAGPVALAAVLDKRTGEAVARVKLGRPDAQVKVHGPFHTPAKLHMKCEGFMLEAFTYTEAAGYVGE